MSKFYYTGSVRQENFLTRTDLILRSFFGTYQNMLFEASLFTIFGIVAFIFYFLRLEFLVNIEGLYFKALGTIFLLLALIYFITNWNLKKKHINTFLTFRVFVYIALGVIFFIMPNSALNSLVQFIITFTLIIALLVFIRKPHKTFLQYCLIVLFILGIVAMYFIPDEYSFIKILIFFIMITIFGIYLFRNGLKFRRSMKSFLDEQKGFTDFKIEE